MMRFSILLVLIFITFLFSCDRNNGNKEQDRISESLAADTLFGKAIPVPDEVGFFDRNHIMVNVKDSLLVLGGQKPEEIFTVFHLPRLDYLYSSGRRGRGPGELSAIFRDAGSYASENELIIYDANKFSLLYYDVSEQGMVFKRRAAIRYSSQTMPLNGVKKLTDSVFTAFYGITEQTNHEFIALQPDNDEHLFTFGNYPESDLEGALRAQKFGKITAAKPDGQKFVSFYTFVPLMKIFDGSGNVLVEQDLKSSENKGAEKENLLYRSRVQASDAFIYVLAPFISAEDREEGRYHPFLEIWNWNGELVKKLVFDEAVINFAVSEKFGHIYCLVQGRQDVIFKHEFEVE